jgi:putative N6-adenine-specific DNA methylase
VETFFASCPRGLEQLLVEDLVAAGARTSNRSSGACIFVPTGRFATGPICTRELPRASSGGWHMRLMRTEDDIYRLALETSLATQWFVPEQTIRVDVNAVKSL